MTMTRPQTAAAAVEATAERDSIQINLIDLDGSFVKRMLAGATLTGESELRWKAAAADLSVLWEIFTAYAAVVAAAVTHYQEAILTLSGGRQPQ